MFSKVAFLLASISLKLFTSTGPGTLFLDDQTIIILLCNHSFIVFNCSLFLRSTAEILSSELKFKNLRLSILASFLSCHSNLVQCYTSNLPFAPYSCYNTAISSFNCVINIAKPLLNPFWPMLSFLTPWKTPAYQRFSGWSRGYEMELLARNGWNSNQFLHFIYVHFAVFHFSA